LLTVENPKSSKGEKFGYLTGILYLAPAQESGVVNVCPFSTEGCRAACLYDAGMSRVFPKIKQARIRKTKWLFDDREGFLRELRNDIRLVAEKAERENLIPTFRLNGTSDLPWLGMQMAREFPQYIFYDYTKVVRPWLRQLPNYHITFSLSESNFQDAFDCLQHGMNVAVVFDVPAKGKNRKAEPLPEMWRGVHVVDGDLTDLRFLDQHRFGLVVGLRAKGKAKQDQSGFVQISGLNG
jgi:hypothetical protein